MAFRQLDDPHPQAFLEQHLEALARGFLACFVLVEVQHDGLGEALQEACVLSGEGGAAGRDDLVTPCSSARATSR